VLAGAVINVIPDEGLALGDDVGVGVGRGVGGLRDKKKKSEKN